MIVPVYNVEEYLPECLDSILSQTLTNIEVICIDDGSSDNSVKILKEYENKDKRIKLLFQKNQGAAVARNAGLKIAEGEYVSILDSDDFFEPDFLEKMYNQCKKLESLSINGINTGAVTDMEMMFYDKGYHSKRDTRFER